MNPFRTPRIFFLRKKRWSAALCLCLAALMFYLVNYPAAVGASAATRQLPIYCVQQDQKLVSISFDAAWGDVRTRPLGRRGSPSSAQMGKALVPGHNSPETRAFSQQPGLDSPRA